MGEPSSEEIVREIRGQRMLLEGLRKISGPECKAAADRVEWTIYAFTLDAIVLGAVDAASAAKAARGVVE